MNNKNLCLLLSLFFYTTVSWAQCFDENKSLKINLENCQRSADLGDATAQYTLGQMYRKGEGVPEDFNKSLSFYKAAAAQGNIPALYNLGWMYDIGNGVEKDESEAIKWYSQAANLGDKYAAFNLGSIYYSKGNLPGSFVETYFWFGVALLNGNPKARRWQNKVVKRMSLEEQQESEKKLNQWTLQYAPSTER